MSPHAEVIDAETRRHQRSALGEPSVRLVRCVLVEADTPNELSDADGGLLL